MPLPGKMRYCVGLTKQKTRCQNPALRDSTYCRVHAPTIERLEKQRPLFGQGTFKLKLPEDADQELLESVLAGLQAEFTLNNSSDMINLEMLAFYFVKWRRTVEGGDDKLAASFDGLVQRNLAALQVTRSTRPAGESTVRTPADVAADIMQKAAAFEEAEALEAAKDLKFAKTDQATQATPAIKKKKKKKSRK